MEFCSNTDQVDLPSWCVEMEFSLWTLLQLFAELILLVIIGFVSYSYFTYRKHKKIEKKKAKRMLEMNSNPQPSYTLITQPVETQSKTDKTKDYD